MSGLVVHARSLDELDAKLPGAIRELVEVGGKKVLAVEILRDDLPEADGFDIPRQFITAAVALSRR